MDLWNDYSQRLNYRRNTRKEYQKRNLEKVVRQQFDNINSHDIVVENRQGEERNQTINIFAKTSAKTTDTLRSHQRFFISLDPLLAGEKVKWNDDIWLVVTSSKDKEVYYEGFLLKSNTKVDWSYTKLHEETGKAYRQIAEEDVAVYDSGRLEGIYDENQIKVPDGQRRVIMPATETSNTLERGTTRFFFDDKTYRLIDVISVEQEGIKFLVMDEIMSSEEYRHPEPEPEPEVDEELDTRYLSAPDYIVANEEYEIRVMNSSYSNNWFILEGEDMINWEIVGRRLVISLKSQRGNIGRKIKIQVVENTGWTDSKEIVVRSVLWRD